MNPMILLPDTLYILRDKTNQVVTTNVEEYSIYYKNILYPFDSNYDIKIDCDFGMNLDRCWRITDFSNCKKTFPLTLSVYLFGELLVKKSITIEIVERNNQELSLLCIGDSMTQAEEYEMQAVIKAEKIKTLGTRCSKLVHHEGRGGLKLYSYRHIYTHAGWFTSPFLFPENIPGELYYGDESMWESVQNEPNRYTSVGFTYKPIQDGMYTLRDGKLYLYKNDSYELVYEAPVFTFDFEKYMLRNQIETPDVVSFLFAANDLQVTPYEQTADEINTMLTYQEEMLENIQKYVKNIIICLPVCGADQYCWGTRMGCKGTVKQYEYNMKHYAKALLEKYDNRQSEGIYICPMSAVCDPDAGFNTDSSPANIYSVLPVHHQTNWVHPNVAGYKQMGDALAGVLCKVKNTL
ncbi:MAG: SGNH/GDSL hydrolase family protein [Clostridia bacterium]|nr:SGNH/GDSL hydrolase family protein [Clostridia bacterium]